MLDSPHLAETPRLHKTQPMATPMSLPHSFPLLLLVTLLRHGDCALSGAVKVIAPLPISATAPVVAGGNSDATATLERSNAAPLAGHGSTAGGTTPAAAAPGANAASSGARATPRETPAAPKPKSATHSGNAPEAAASATPGTPAAPPRPIGFTVISRYNPRTMVLGYQPIVDYLSRATPYQFELVLSRDYFEAVERLCRGEVYLASLGGMTCVRAHQECNAEPLLRPLSPAGLPSYRSAIVVRADSDLRRLSDLRGRSFGFTSPLSTSGALVPIHDLHRAGVHLRELGAYRFLDHHDSVARAVLLGTVDAGAMKEVVAQKFLPAGLRIIHRSAPIPAVPIVAAPGCPPEVRESVIRALLRIDPNDPTQARMLAEWDPEFAHGFVAAPWSAYAPLVAMEEELRAAGLQVGQWNR